MVHILDQICIYNIPLIAFSSNFFTTTSIKVVPCGFLDHSTCHLRLGVFFEMVRSPQAIVSFLMIKKVVLPREALFISLARCDKADETFSSMHFAFVPLEAAEGIKPGRHMRALDPIRTLLTGSQKTQKKSIVALFNQ
jgi:hypothetical protein